MTVWCSRCQSWSHAEEWHTFTYRRWFVSQQRAGLFGGRRKMLA